MIFEILLHRMILVDFLLEQRIGDLIKNPGLSPI